MSFSVLEGCSTVSSTLTSFLVGNFISFSESGTVLEYADSTFLGLFSKFSNLGISLPPNFLYSKYLSIFSSCLPLSNDFSNSYLVDSNFAFNFSSSLTWVVVSSSTVISLGDTTSKSSTVLGLSTLATTISLAKGLSSFGIDLTTSCTSVLGTTLSTTFFLGSFFLVSVFLGVVFSVVSVVVVSTFDVFSGVVVVSTVSLFTVKGCTISFIVSPFLLTLVVSTSSFNAKGFTISFVVSPFLLTLVVSVLGFLTLDLSIYSLNAMNALIWSSLKSSFDSLTCLTSSVTLALSLSFKTPCLSNLSLNSVNLPFKFLNVPSA